MFQLIVQAPFTQRLESAGVKIRNAGDHITDPDEIEALRGHRNVVGVNVDDPEPEAAFAPKALPLIPPAAPAAKA